MSADRLHAKQPKIAVVGTFYDGWLTFLRLVFPFESPKTVGTFVTGGCPFFMTLLCPFESLANAACALWSLCRVAAQIHRKKKKVDEATRKERAHILSSPGRDWLVAQKKRINRPIKREKKVDKQQHKTEARPIARKKVDKTQEHDKSRGASHVSCIPRFVRLSFRNRLTAPCP